MAHCTFALWAGVGFEIAIFMQGFKNSVVDDTPYLAILRVTALNNSLSYPKVLLKLRFSYNKKESKS